MTVTAKPMEVSGILMVAARIVRNGRILISGRKNTTNGASRRSMRVVLPRTYGRKFIQDGGV